MYFSKKDAQQITDASNNALRQRGTEPSNLKEDLLKLFRGLIGQTREKKPMKSITYETNIPEVKNSNSQFLTNTLTRLKNMTPEEQKEADRLANEAMINERSTIGIFDSNTMNEKDFDVIPVDSVPVEDFGGVNLGIQGAKQRELDDTIYDKVLTEQDRKSLLEKEKKELKKQTGLSSLVKSDRYSNFQNSPMFQFGNKEDNFLQDMFSQKKIPFKNKDIGKAYVDNVLDTVFEFVPKDSISNISRLRDTLLHTAEKESQFGSYKGTYKKKNLSKEKSVGHGGIQQVTDGTFDDVFFNNPIPEVQEMVNKLKEKTGIDINKIKKSKQKNTDRQNFLRTPFGSNFAAAAVYIDQLNKGGKESFAAKKYFNRDDSTLPFDPATMRNYFYFKGEKYANGPRYKWSELDKDLKKDKDNITIAEEMLNKREEFLKQQKQSGGMIESDPYKREPRFI